MSQRDMAFLVYEEEPRIARPHHLDLLYDTMDDIDYAAGRDIGDINALCKIHFGPSGSRWMRNPARMFRWNFRDSEDAMLIKLMWETG